MWKDCRVLVTGGSSFIGSHIVDVLLVKRRAKMRVVDDLIEFIKTDLREPCVARKAVEGINIVFQLARGHGGRGKEVNLTEDVVKPPYDADNMYGWAKLMAE